MTSASISRVRRIVTRLALIALASLLALLVGEVAMRVAGLGEKGTLGTLYQADERLGWRHNANVTTVQADREFSVTWHLDEHGYRRASPLGNGPIIVALGDSHTAGHGVETHETWSAQLETRLRASSPGATVINAGVVGYAAAQQLLSLEELLDRHDVAGVVVASYLGNDLRELFESVGVARFRRPLLDRNGGLLNPIDDNEAAERVDGVAGLKAWFAEHSRLYVVVGESVRDGPLQDVLASLGLMTARTEGPPSARDRCGGCYGQMLWAQQRLALHDELAQKSVRLHAALLHRMSTLCAERGVSFAVMFVPSLAEVAGHDALVADVAAQLEIPGDAKERLGGWRRAVLDACAGLAVIDLLPAMTSSVERALYYPFDWHLTPHGQAVVAEAVEGVIASDGWLVGR